MARPDGGPIYAERLYDLFQTSKDYGADVAALKELARVRGLMPDQLDLPRRDSRGSRSRRRANGRPRAGGRPP